MLYKLLHTGIYNVQILSVAHWLEYHSENVCQGAEWLRGKQVKSFSYLSQ